MLTLWAVFAFWRLALGPICALSNFRTQMGDVVNQVGERIRSSSRSRNRNLSRTGSGTGSGCVISNANSCIAMLESYSAPTIATLPLPLAVGKAHVGPNWPMRAHVGHVGPKQTLRAKGTQRALHAIKQPEEMLPTSGSRGQVTPKTQLCGLGQTKRGKQTLKPTWAFDDHQAASSRLA